MIHFPFRKKDIYFTCKNSVLNVELSNLVPRKKRNPGNEVERCVVFFGFFSWRIVTKKMKTPRRPGKDHPVYMRLKTCQSEKATS